VEKFELHAIGQQVASSRTSIKEFILQDAWKMMLRIVLIPMLFFIFSREEERKKEES